MRNSRLFTYVGGTALALALFALCTPEASAFGRRRGGGCNGCYGGGCYGGGWCSGGGYCSGGWCSGRVFYGGGYCSGGYCSGGYCGGGYCSGGYYGGGMVYGGGYSMPRTSYYPGAYMSGGYASGGYYAQPGGYVSGGYYAQPGGYVSGGYQSYYPQGGYYTYPPQGTYQPQHHEGTDERPDNGTAKKPDRGQPAKAKKVDIEDGSFEPARMEISTGTTVVWTNRGEKPHTVTDNDGGFDSGQLKPGQTFRQTFDEAGTYNYHCALHPKMRGTIVVK